MRSCSSCGGSVEPGQFTCDFCRKRQREVRWLAGIVAAFILAIVLALTLAHAIVVYGDWRCAFAKCQIVEVKQR